MKTTTLYFVVRDGQADVVTKVQPGHEVVKKIKVKRHKVRMSIWDNTLGDYVDWRHDRFPEIGYGSVPVCQPWLASR